MLRAILSILLGYVTMAVVVMITFGVSQAILGLERVFAPESYAPSSLWIFLSFVFGFVAAVAGGLVCALVAKRAQPPMVLAGLVFALGLLLAVFALTSDAPVGVRAADVTFAEAVQNARQPGWVACCGDRSAVRA